MNKFIWAVILTAIFIGVIPTLAGEMFGQNTPYSLGLSFLSGGVGAILYFEITRGLS